LAKRVNDIQKQLLQLIRDVGAQIQPHLLPKPGHQIRNGYAHIFKVINVLCKKSYDKVEPDKVRAIVEAIRLHPNGTASEISKHGKLIYKQLKEYHEDGKTIQQNDNQ
jgi:hypothetical protein